MRMSDNAKRREREIPAWVHRGLEELARQTMEDLQRTPTVPLEEMRWRRQIFYRAGFSPDEELDPGYVESWTIPRWARGSIWLAWPVDRALRLWAWTKILCQEQRDYWKWVFKRAKEKGDR